MNEFFVGQFRVDMSRSQIVAQDAIVSMEPKVLQVLLTLAEKQGQVVTHQQILDSVWKDVTVAPNTLQRCITQLRKALGDDAKQQNIIKTHPKVGYSLVADVTWSTSLSTNPVKTTNHKSTFLPKWLSNSHLFIILPTILLAYFLIHTVVSQSPPESSLPLTKLSAFTTTDKREFSPTYSPDGRYIAFQRYVGLCENELWAKDLLDNREYLLTRNTGIYGTPSWSPDGQKLAFSNVTHCSLTNDFQGCKDIRTLSFALAKSEPQETRILIPCDQQGYSATTWINNDQIALIEKKGQQQQVLSFKLSTQQLEVLYQGKKTNFISLAYSQTLQKLAIAQHDQSLQSSMILLDIKTKQASQFLLKPPKNFTLPAFRSINWHPTESLLITAQNSSIFEIDLKGNFVEHSVPTMQSIHAPVFHPDGQNLIASMGIFDKDIKILHWGNQQNSNKPYQIKPIHRTIVTEQESKFQPAGEQIAYISLSSGMKQIWLSSLKPDSLETISQPRQLTHLTNNPYISSFEWSYDGQLIIAVINRQLKLLNLDGQLTAIDTPYDVIEIYQAPADNQVLLKIIEKQQEKIVLFDINTLKNQVIYEGSVNWAQISESGQLFIDGPKKTILQVINNEAIEIEGIDDIRVSNQFLYNANKLVLVGLDNSIWIYDLNKRSKEKLFKVIDTLKHIDSVDLKQQRMLVTTVASIKQEIVLFHR